MAPCLWDVAWRGRHLSVEFENDLAEKGIHIGGDGSVVSVGQDVFIIGYQDWGRIARISELGLNPRLWLGRAAGFLVCSCNQSKSSGASRRAEQAPSDRCGATGAQGERVFLVLCGAVCCCLRCSLLLLWCCLLLGGAVLLPAVLFVAAAVLP